MKGFVMGLYLGYEGKGIMLVSGLSNKLDGCDILC